MPKPRNEFPPFEWRELAATLAIAGMCALLWTVTAILCGGAL